jgi:predicted Zn finger-like uncharacterized protein
MSVSVTCRQCTTAYRVADSAAGKSMKCKKCGEKIAIPAATNGSKSATNGGTPTPKKGGATKPLLIVGGLLAGFCVLCTGISGFSSWWFCMRTPTIVVKDAAHDAFKDAFKDIAKDLGGPGPVIVVKDAAKDAFKDAFKDLAKDLAKDFAKDLSKGFK